MPGFLTPPILQVEAKAPFDEYDQPFDFSNLLAAGDTIASASVTATPAGLTLGTPGSIPSQAGVAGQGVGVNISGGALYAEYTVTVEIVTTSGDQWERSIMLPVQQR